MGSAPDGADTRGTLDATEAANVTRSERLLSWVLAGFIFLALIWGYERVDDAIREAHYDTQSSLISQQNQVSKQLDDRRRSFGLEADQYGYATSPESTDAPAPATGTGTSTSGSITPAPVGGPTTTAPSTRRDYSQEAIDDLEAKARRLDKQNVTARERFRTALEANRASERLEAEYRAADRALRRAEADLKSLRAARTKALAAFRPFEAKADRRSQVIDKKLEADRRSAERQIFLLRALLAFGMLGLSFYALRRTLERVPRLLPLAQAAVAATALIAIVMIFDYSDVGFDFSTVGPFGLAVLGGLLTVAAFFVLQRYLVSHVPARRLRAGECRNCGYPARDHTFCEHCGEQLLGVCDICEQPRVLGAPHCANCGATHISI